MISDIVIVSLGKGNPDFLNSRTIHLLYESKHLILRTGRHPIVPWLISHQISFSTLDFLYDEADDFDHLCRSISDYLFAQASDSTVVYAVTDAITDSSVRFLLRYNTNERQRITVIPGTGIYDYYLASSLPHLSDTPVVCTTAYEFQSKHLYDPNLSLLIVELDNPVLAGQLKILLSEVLNDNHAVFLLSGDEKPVEIPLYLLDRQMHIDHFTALFVPGSSFLSRDRYVMNDLALLMDTLRSQEGCPWDQRQTHHSLRSYLIEEAFECIASIDENDMTHLCEELGDLLFQIVFHSSIGKSYDEFSLNDVISAICMKMIRRHPHVFSEDSECRNPVKTEESWEKIKRLETGKQTVVSSLDDVPTALPSILYAAKTFKKLNQIDMFRRSPEQILKDICTSADRMNGEKKEAYESVLGHLLLCCAELCTSCNMNGELLLHHAVDQLKNRVKSLEKRVSADGKSLEHLTFDELGVYLSHVKDETE